MLDTFTVDVTRAGLMPAATYIVRANGRAHACAIASGEHKARAWAAIAAAVRTLNSENPDGPTVVRALETEMVATFQRSDFLAAVR